MSAADERKAFQDYYPETTKHCYGCGARNPDGYRIRSFADGDEAVCRFTPEPFHTAVPGAVYGGMIASLIDCHGPGPRRGRPTGPPDGRWTATRRCAS